MIVISRSIQMAQEVGREVIVRKPVIQTVRLSKCIRTLAKSSFYLRVSATEGTSTVM
jgi:hypothetical protein